MWLRGAPVGAPTAEAGPGAKRKGCDEAVLDNDTDVVRGDVAAAIASMEGALGAAEHLLCSSIIKG